MAVIAVPIAVTVPIAVPPMEAVTAVTVMEAVTRPGGGHCVDNCYNRNIDLVPVPSDIRARAERHRNRRLPRA